MSREPIDLSRGDGKTVLGQLLAEWTLDYVQFSRLLGLDRRSLWRWRSGQRECRLSMRQIKTLEKLLEKSGLRLADLPEDWILDHPEKNKD
jgi:transcriptional regulator with XRE-family HTH domain